MIDPNILQSALNVSSAWKSAATEYKDAIKDIGEINCIVEIGVDFGYSLFTLANDFPNAVVFGFDPYLEYGHANDAKSHVLRHVKHFPNIRLELLSSIDGHNLWRKPTNYMDIDLLHIDGDHSYSGVSSDFNTWVAAVRPGGAIMFHDIYAFPNDVGKFFSELEGNKVKLNAGGPGLGIWFKED